MARLARLGVARRAVKAVRRVHGLSRAFLPRSSYGDGIALLRLGGGLVISITILTAMCAPRALRYLAALWGISPILAVLIPGFF